MTRIHRSIPALLMVFLALPSAYSIAASEEANRVESATEVLSKIMEIPESAIPPVLLADAQGVAIIPGVIKVGLVVGGQYGRGVLTVRGKGGAWSNPVFITLMSGSIGWQIGAESTDFVVVFKTPRSIEGIMKGKYTLGADAACGGRSGGTAGEGVHRHRAEGGDLFLLPEPWTLRRHLPGGILPSGGRQEQRRVLRKGKCRSLRDSLGEGCQDARGCRKAEKITG